MSLMRFGILEHGLFDEFWFKPDRIGTYTQKYDGWKAKKTVFLSIFVAEYLLGQLLI